MGERTGSRSCPWSDYRLMVSTLPSYPIFPLIQRLSQSINHPLHLHNLILSILPLYHLSTPSVTRFVNSCPSLDSINTTIQIPQSMRFCLYMYHFIFFEYLYSTVSFSKSNKINESNLNKSRNVCIVR
jgi:preprotein translocase subunit SecY